LKKRILYILLGLLLLSVEGMGQTAPVVSSNKSTFCQGDFTAKLSLYSADQELFYYWQKQLPDLSWQDISSQQYIAIGGTDLYTPDLSNPAPSVSAITIFGSASNYPSCVSYSQQRRVFGNTNTEKE
jgi:hypothetical protein